MLIKVMILNSYYDSAMCFVCAHLAAHQENVSGRNADYRNIIERSVFPSSSATLVAFSGGDSSTSLSQQASGSSGEGQCQAAIHSSTWDTFILQIEYFVHGGEPRATLT